MNEKIYRYYGLLLYHNANAVIWARPLTPSSVSVASWTRCMLSVFLLYVPAVHTARTNSKQPLRYCHTIVVVAATYPPELSVIRNLPNRYPLACSLTNLFEVWSLMYVCLATIRSSSSSNRMFFGPHHLTCVAPMVLPWQRSTLSSRTRWLVTDRVI